MKEPMLAFNETVDLDKLPYPMLASFKMDGMRAVITPDGPRARSMKPHTNLHVQNMLGTLPPGLDGEIGVIGDDGAVNFRATVSKLRKADTVCDFKFFVFDHYLWENEFTVRSRSLEMLRSQLPEWVELVQQRWVNNAAEVRAMFAEALALGHEGLILRSMKAAYKFGRSTLNEAGMLKVKPWDFTEVAIIGMVEAQKNNNEQKRDERGKAKRSSAKAGKVGKGTLGALILSDLSRWPKPFEVGTGWTAKEAQEMWDDQANIVGKMFARIKFLDVGGYDVPRSCVFEGLRLVEDMGL